MNRSVQYLMQNTVFVNIRCINIKLTPYCSRVLPFLILDVSILNCTIHVQSIPPLLILDVSILNNLYVGYIDHNFSDSKSN